MVVMGLLDRGRKENKCVVIMSIGWSSSLFLGNLIYKI